MKVEYFLKINLLRSNILTYFFSVKLNSPITLVQHYESDTNSQPKMASLEDSDSTISDDVFYRLTTTKDKLTSKIKKQK